MKHEETIDFNVAAVKKMSKKDFVEQHKDHPAEMDWASKYDELTKPEEETKEPVKKEVKEKSK